MTTGEWLMLITSRQKVDRPEIFWEFTRSICPECKRVIDAHILLRDNKVYMRKRCPQHGQFEALVFGDAQLYTQIQRYNKPGTLPLQFATAIRRARDDKFLAGLQRLKPHIYLQFDGFEPATNLAIRGRANLIDDRLRALDRLAEADVRAVLVGAVERGVNEHEVGRIVEFGLRHPAVFGVNFQPAFRAQRHLPGDPLTRLTIPDIIKAL